MRLLLIKSFVLCLLVGSCSGEPPQVPAGPNGQVDQVLLEGRDIYGRHCASCHGRGGGGGIGPQINDGELIKNYENIAEQVAIIVNGAGSMPSFAQILSQTEVEAVTRYTREVLN